MECFCMSELAFLKVIEFNEYNDYNTFVSCHDSNKTFPYGYLVDEWLERLTSERVIGGSNPVNGIIFLPNLNCIFFAFLSMYRNGRPQFEIGIEHSPQISLNHVTGL